MLVSVVSSIRSSTLHRPDRTAEHGPGKVGELVHDAGVVTLSVESEGKQTGSFYAIFPVILIIEGVCPADLCSDLIDVSIAIRTGRVRVSRWCVVHVVLSCYPGQVARELGIDSRVLGFLAQLRIRRVAAERKVGTALRESFKYLISFC